MPAGYDGPVAGSGAAREGRSLPGRPCGWCASPVSSDTLVRAVPSTDGHNLRGSGSRCVRATGAALPVGRSFAFWAALRRASRLSHTLTEQHHRRHVRSGQPARAADWLKLGGLSWTEMARGRACHQALPGSSIFCAMLRSRATLACCGTRLPCLAGLVLQPYLPIGPYMPSGHHASHVTGAEPRPGSGPARRGAGLPAVAGCRLDQMRL